ncbi:PD40 domain-containing protein, partial [Candidatus Aerophobetes bacterium]|nr:PD40 domain-containing protein [Candidatus Aerophobetes bacterium]
IIFVTIVLSTPILGFNGFAADVKVIDADATSIHLYNIRVLDKKGKYPCFSPDGKQILFTKNVEMKEGSFKRKVASLWIVDCEGRNKKMILERGFNGVWSPDGNRIAYCTMNRDRGFGEPPNILAIFDLTSKKIFKLTSLRCYNAKIRWTKDGRKISIKTRGIDGIRLNIVDLDTLSSTSLQKAESLAIVEHPKVLFYTQEGVFSTWGYKPSGLYIKNRDGTFYKCLRAGDFSGEVSLSYDLSKIVFCGRWGGIYIASLGVRQNPPNITFRVDIGRAHLLSKWVTKNMLTKYFKKGTIKASIFEPKINPLNKKVVGAGKKLKGYVKFIKMFDDYSIVKIYGQLYPINVGDVISEVRADCDGMGTRTYGKKIWSSLKLIR